MNTIKTLIIIVIFILGLVFYCKNYGRAGIEGLNNGSAKKNAYKCPNLLIKKDNNIFLYNSQEAVVPGVNPIQFNNLEDYVEFTEWQRSQNITCPVLYLEQNYNSQNNKVYSVKKNPFSQPDVVIPQYNLPVLGGNLQGTSPLDNAGRDNPPYNQKDISAFDPKNQYIGLKTPLDKIFQDKSQSVSANPMDPNWGGMAITQEAVDKGKYKQDSVSLYVD